MQLAARGFDLLLVARDADRWAALIKTQGIKAE